MTHKQDRRRVDVFFQLAATDLLRLDDEGWERLYDGLAVAVFGVPRQKKTTFNEDGAPMVDDFNFAAYSAGARPAVGRAKLKIMEFLESLRTGKVVEFRLSEERLFLQPSSNRFAERYRFNDIETMIYRGFLEAIKRINVSRDAFYVCSDPRCGRMFLPPRQPRPGVRVFCERKHRQRVAQADSRARSEPGRRRSSTKERALSRERSHRHYARKVTAGRPNVKVARRKRV